MSTEHDEFLEAQCAAEEAQGRHPSAIKLMKALRDHASMGLKEGKDTVEDFCLRRGSATPKQPIHDYDAWLTAHVAQLEGRGEKPDRISLIKALREQSNLGLREAKDIVDAYCHTKRPDIPAAIGPGLLGQVSKMLGLRE